MLTATIPVAEKAKPRKVEVTHARAELPALTASTVAAQETGSWPRRSGTWRAGVPATIGKRLVESNRRVQETIRGDNRSTAVRLGASAVLGALWRPLRTLTEIDAAREQDAMLAAAMAVVSTVRAL